MPGQGLTQIHGEIVVVLANTLLESRDADDRASNYDRYYSGGEGLTILFAAGNDGPDPDTVTPRQQPRMW